MWAVVSVFALQQLPEPELSIQSWVASLRPAGRLSVVFWPDATELDGPFALMAEVVRAHVPAGDNSWENGLVAALTEQGAVVANHPFVDGNKRAALGLAVMLLGANGADLSSLDEDATFDLVIDIAGGKCDDVDTIAKAVRATFGRRE